MLRRSLLLTALAAPAAAQGRRAIRLVIPFPPSGATDIAGRLLAERLTALLGQSVVVENRSGGGGLVGADAVAKGPADGTMLGFISAATLCGAPFLQASMPFDVRRDFRFISQITDSAVVLVVGAQQADRYGWTDLASVLDWARRHPGSFRVAYAGAGAVSHLAMAALVKTSGLDISLVPYRGGAQAATDVMAGTIEASADLPGTVMSLVQSGQLRMLGVSSGTRLALLPSVPAFAETAGLQALDIRSWNMIVVPAATPDAEVARLHAGIRQVGSSAEFRDAMKPLGYDAVTSATPEAAATLVREETPRWERLVRESGARAD
ncbi:Bug family tripartite tricarboxylate transporter substrate binding protein [Plastoroseomonas arctica]|uniref:Tripartite tricarboxylate transporter substrate binding protein n=1 Tax=Plastoroseomonas arctica TaxID=1509237 RepID=A0AAF1K058_9PROT|nr:tripartite tricarboxylate transporter substrate binding protein [Plastoroseomonas arctica]MBR0654549.1 tripartite tricarboxylate transporter substrate binding protein [Plastoroseomonas arctica]